MTEERKKNSDANLEEGSFFTLLKGLKDDSSSGSNKKKNSRSRSAAKPALSDFQYISAIILVISLLVFTGVFLFTDSEIENIIDADITALNSVEENKVILNENMSSGDIALPLAGKIKNADDKAVGTLSVSQESIVNSQDEKNNKIQVKDIIDITPVEITEAVRDIVGEQQPANSKIEIPVSPHLLPIPSSDSIKDVDVINAISIKKIIISSDSKKVTFLKSQHKLKPKSQRNSYQKALLAGNTLLAENPQNHYLLQLMAVNKLSAENRLDEILFNLPTNTDPIVIFSSQNEQNIIYVCYGYYKSKGEAKEALQLLDNDLISYDPYVISIEKIIAKVQP